MGRALLIGFVLLVTLVAVPLFGAVPASAAPTMSWLSPADMAKVSTIGFRAVVNVQGFIIDQVNFGLANIAGHGHLHFFVDGGYVGAIAQTGFDFGTLTVGSHVISAALHNNDHSALIPPVSAQITVQAGPTELRVLEPVGGATVSSLGFRVRVAVSNFTLDPQDYAGAPIPGQGHIHVTSTTLLAAVATESVVITGQAVGPLNLNVSVHNNDHSPISPAVFKLLTVTVAAPSIQASAPVSIEVGQALNVSWTVNGFVLDNAAFGGTPEAGRGHVHVFVDGTYNTATAGTSVSLSGLATGTHTIRVELYNNDHTELPTMYESTKTVVVKAPATPPAPQPAGFSPTVFYGSVGFLILIIVILGVLLARKGRGGTKTPGETQGGT